MNHNLEVIGEYSARRTLMQQHAIREGDQASSTLAELVRSAIWTLQPQSTHALKPVHRHRIVAMASASAAVLLNVEDAGDLLSRTIDELIVIGELDRAGNGYMLPAPLRWIEMPDTPDRKLLVGGVPTRALPVAIQKNIRYRHHVREGKGGGLPVQSLDAWLNRPSESLDDWLSVILEREHAKAKPITAVELARREWQRYPSVRHDFQFCRWKSVDENDRVSSGVYLARVRNASAISSWGLLWVDGGGLLMTEIRPSDVDVRRIMYALDHRHGWGTTVTIRRDTEHDTLRVWNELPRPEQRYLTAISERVNNQEGKYYPRLWRIPKVYDEVELKDTFARLEVRLRYEK